MPSMNLPADVFDYGHGISAVDSVYDRRLQTAIHLLVEKGRAAVIDTGTSHAVPHVLAALQAKGVAPEQVDYVILTHVHLDHAGAAGQLMARFPNAQLTVHPRGARHMIDPSRLLAATVAIYGEQETRRVYGEILPVPQSRVIETPDEATLRLAGRELLFLDAPGHARHHVVVQDSRTGHIFAGDTFGLSYRELDQDGRQFSFPTTRTSCPGPCPFTSAEGEWTRRYSNGSSNRSPLSKLTSNTRDRERSLISVGVWLGMDRSMAQAERPP